MLLLSFSRMCIPLIIEETALRSLLVHVILSYNNSTLSYTLDNEFTFYRRQSLILANPNYVFTSRTHYILGISPYIFSIVKAMFSHE